MFSVKGATLPMTRLISFLLLSTFFASGCAALIYQLVWQRYLFTGLGVDIDSVTLIVATFMLGIGIGGALGGWLADRRPHARLKMYAMAELALAVIGLSSPWLFSGVQSMGASGLSYGAVSVVAVVVVLLPTVIMGTTLPLLTLHFDETLANVGVSVGMLYFFNTLGAAFGAWLTANVLFMHWGLDASVWVAAAINLTCFGVSLLAAKLSDQSRGNAFAVLES
jgi:predicted membrane-bound spermidine synthase